MGQEQMLFETFVTMRSVEVEAMSIFESEYHQERPVTDASASFKARFENINGYVLYIISQAETKDIIAFPPMLALNEPLDTAILSPNTKALESSVRTG